MIKYFSKLENDNLVLFASKVREERDDGSFLCECAYGVIQFNSKDYSQKVKSADNREWYLRSDFETEQETVVQRMKFELNPVI